MRYKTIRGRIFYNYAIVLFLVILLFFISINIYMNGILNHNAQDTLSRLSYSVSEQIDTQSNGLYNFALNVCSSASVRSYFFADNADHRAIKSNEKNITDLILSISGPMYRFHRLILRRSDGWVYEYSSREISLVQENGKAGDIGKALEKKGAPHFRETFLDDTASLFKDAPVISVVVAFPEIYGNQYVNTIEVQQTYDSYSEIIQNALSSKQKEGSGYQAYVFNEEGESVYPFQNEDAEEIKEKKGDYYYDAKGNKYVGQSYVSKMTGWTTLVLCKNKDVTMPIFRFTAVSSVVMLLLFGVLLAIAYSISKTITVPLQKIQDSIEIYNLENPESVQVLEENQELDELAALSNTFYNMQERMKEYVDELIAVRTHDLQSQFAALQSQTNPHFIYNSISLLSIMCEEEGNMEAVEFCHELTSMLRYSAANFRQQVTLEDEMAYAGTYLKLLQKRYEGMLDTEIVMPKGLLSKIIPKITVQPLVENCIKYGLDSKPPWFISAECIEFEDGWGIIVSDTGTGFSEQKFTELQRRIEKIDVSNKLPELEINGMGILSIYIRLKMFYKDRVLFRIGNQTEGGAFVEIRILEEKE